MTAHCSFPALDDSAAPATLSHLILTGLLRDKMKFGGVIITDCLEMGAVEKRYPANESACLAVRAGADMLLICHTLDKQLAAIDALVRDVEGSGIPEERIDESFARVQAIKRRASNIPAAHDYVPQSELGEEIARRAVTLVKNENRFLPLRLDRSARLALVTPLFELLTKVEDTGQHNESFVREMKRFHPNLEHHEIPVRPQPEEIRRTLEKCKDADTLVILTYNLHLNPAQRECAQALVDLGKPAVVAAVRDPHDLAFIERARAYVATYSFRECSLKALADVLFGKIEPAGTLPVKL
jgi:beta-N-acetylhexosaminidase